MYCTKCGKEMNGNFCTGCGNKIETKQNIPQVKIPNYMVLQVILKEKLIGTGSKNLTELENVINNQAAKGYRLHTISTTSSGSSGMLGGDRIQATLVFEKL